MTKPEIKEMLVQARRYLYAGLQDADMVVRAMHLSYAKAILDMLNQLANKQDADAVMREEPGLFTPGYRYDAFYGDVAANQDRTILALIGKLQGR